jgi:hypothetical protein
VFRVEPPRHRVWQRCRGVRIAASRLAARVVSPAQSATVTARGCHESGLNELNIANCRSEVPRIACRTRPQIASIYPDFFSTLLAAAPGLLFDGCSRNGRVGVLDHSARAARCGVTVREPCAATSGAVARLAVSPARAKALVGAGNAIVLAVGIPDACAGRYRGSGRGDVRRVARSSVLERGRAIWRCIWRVSGAARGSRHPWNGRLDRATQHVDDQAGTALETPDAPILAASARGSGADAKSQVTGRCRHRLKTDPLSPAEN